jgi:hypothetical protein
MVNPAGEIAPMGLANKQFDQLRLYQSETRTLKCVSVRPHIQTFIILDFLLNATCINTVSLYECYTGQRVR